MERCKDCAFWAQDDFHTSNTLEARKCCDAIPHIEDKGADQSIAVASDTEGYHAHLETRADFGCVLWKKRGSI
jgi:hypothetical protein